MLKLSNRKPLIIIKVNPNKSSDWLIQIKNFFDDQIKTKEAKQNVTKMHSSYKQVILISKCPVYTMDFKFFRINNG